MRSKKGSRSPGWSRFRLTQDEIAKRVGKSRPYVSNAIRLLELPQAILR